MSIPFRVLTAALAASLSPAWATTSNVDVYGIINNSVQLTHQIFSSTYDLESGTVDPLYTPLSSIANNSGDPAFISGSSHEAHVQTDLGSNHVYLKQRDAFSPSIFATTANSIWYDQITITGGVGTGTASFSVHVNGVVDVGAYSVAAGYLLSISNQHPSEGTALSAAWGILASPNSEINHEAVLLQILTPGTGQSIDFILDIPYDFTYGEAFYVLGNMSATAADLPFLLSYCAPDCIPNSDPDGTGPTTFDFSNSAHLISIVLPEGASLSSASSTTYNVSTVPEPGEWLMLLAGLGLVGWRARHRRIA